MVYVQGDACDDADSGASYYLAQEKQNHHACDIINASGYIAADTLRKSLRRMFVEEEQHPVTREAIQDQLMTASTAGDIFRAGPGMLIAICIAEERKIKEEKIDRMKKDKKLLEG
jgi:hypothetical protein